MMFRSNTEMVRHYCKELLADGRDHSIPEIRAYVNKKTGKKGIDGELLSPALVGGALRDLSVITNFCSRTRRGYYRKGCTLPQGISPDLPLQEQIYERIKVVLADTRREIKACLTMNVLDCPFSEEEALALGAKGREVLRLLEEVERVAAPSPAPTLEKQTAASAPKPAPPDQNEAATGEVQGEPERWPRRGMTL